MNLVSLATGNLNQWALDFDGKVAPADPCRGS